MDANQRSTAGRRNPFQPHDNAHLRFGLWRIVHVAACWFAVAAHLFLCVGCAARQKQPVAAVGDVFAGGNVAGAGDVLYSSERPATSTPPVAQATAQSPTMSNIDVAFPHERTAAPTGGEPQEDSDAAFDDTAPALPYAQQSPADRSFADDGNVIREITLDESLVHALQTGSLLREI
ncbi:MAG: hypothetical protein AAFP69_14690, partial [Planctomycetota bacterium]